MEREADYDHQERLGHRGSRPCRSLPLLRWAGDPWAVPFVAGQATGERQGGPRHQPVVQVLIGEAPQGAQEREQQQRFLGVASGATAWTRRQRRRTAPVSEAYR